MDDLNGAVIDDRDEEGWQRGAPPSILPSLATLVLTAEV